MTRAQDLGRVLVTGGASGLGAAVVSAVIAAGGTAAVIDRDPPGRDDAVWVRADVSDRQAVESAVAWLAERIGGLDAVVTAAGIDRCGRLGVLPMVVVCSVA